MIPATEIQILEVTIPNGKPSYFKRKIFMFVCSTNLLILFSETPHYHPGQVYDYIRVHKDDSSGKKEPKCFNTIASENLLTLFKNKKSKFELYVLYIYLYYTVYFSNKWKVFVHLNVLILT